VFLSGCPRVLVILPTYNERATIGRVLDALLARSEAIDILVIDDSSPDGTGDVVAARRDPRVRLQVRPTKGGLGSAYLAGFRTALDGSYDLIVEMDADLSHDPSELGALLEACRSHDLVVGSRQVEGGSVENWSYLRRALSRAGNTYARLMLGIPLRDATSGYRVYRRALLEELLREPITATGYAFQVELVLRSWRLGYDLHEVPITFREREGGVSKMSWRVILEAVWLVTRWGVQARRALPGRGAPPPARRLARLPSWCCGRRGRT
jgi:dolichol-phosphate mannosyltransferase